MTTRRTVLVTGASGGIGRAAVEALLGAGHCVVGFDLRDHPGPTQADHIHVRGDVCSAAGLDTAVTTALDRFGRLDAVVAAAAVMDGGHPLWETPQELYHEVMRVDAYGVWLTAARTIPALMDNPARDQCRFVAVASAAAHRGLFGLAAYNAAKHAVVGIVKGLSADLVGTGITACAVSPGSTRTPMLERTAEIYGLDSAEAFSQHQRIRRLIEPEEMAQAILVCTSPAGAVFNGNVLQADGGFE